MNKEINLHLKTPARFLCWQCRVRSAHTALPTARKTTANAVHLLFPTHAQENVSELDRKKGKLKIKVEMDRKRGMACRTPNERFGIMAGVPRWIDGEKQQVKWLVASVGSPPLRQAATTLHAMADNGKTCKAVRAGKKSKK